MTPAEKFIILKLITKENQIITSLNEKYNLSDLLTEFAEKQASFISSNPDVSGSFASVNNLDNQLYDDYIKSGKLKKQLKGK